MSTDTTQSRDALRDGEPTQARRPLPVGVAG